MHRPLLAAGTDSPSPMSVPAFFYAQCSFELASKRTRSVTEGLWSCQSQTNRRSHIRMVVAMIRKSARHHKPETKGATRGNGPAIKGRPVVTGDGMGH
jgi:hypothetical protein